jgi:uncharacterized membrane protein
MTRSFLKKGLTLLSSLTLVTLFLLYRTGIFDRSLLNNQNSLQTSHNGGTINPGGINKTKNRKDSIDPLLFSSSKVMILTDKTPNYVDSIRKFSAKYKYQKNETEILSSSKSSIIFKPKQTSKFNPDSFFLKYDTSKMKKKKEQ